MKKIFVLILLIVNMIYAFSTLDKVKARGMINCGVNNDLLGFGFYDKEEEEWKGVNIDYCRALSSAIFDRPDKVNFVSTTIQDSFKMLREGKVDVLARNTTWTLKRDTALGLKFAGVTYYDGQGFMMLKEFGIKSVRELNNAYVCVLSHSTTELNLKDFFKNNNMKYKALKYSSNTQIKDAFIKNKCDTVTSDKSSLYSMRATMKNPSDYMILPETISKEPLGPIVKEGDDAWLNIARWVAYAMVQAEELGVNKANAPLYLTSNNRAIRRLVGTEYDMGKELGLKIGWAYNIIVYVGNYADVFERNIGSNTALNIDRGQNALWANGGLMYSMPMR